MVAAGAMSAAHPLQDEGLEERLRRAVERHLGACDAVSGIATLAGGASREIIGFRADGGGVSRDVVLRRDPPGRPDGTGAVEFALMTAAHARGVPTPEPVFALDPDDDLGEGYVMTRVEGETLGRRIVEAPDLDRAREGLTSGCAAALAGIHAIPPAEVEGLRDGSGAAELERWTQVLDRIGEPHPVLEVALRHLADEAPPPAAPVVVHGDFRNGNLVVGPDGLRAVLDWELAHLGDPIEDLGWLCVRAWRFTRPDLPVGGFGRREDLLAAYEEASGHAVDAARLRYWELFGNFKWAVVCLQQAHTHLSGAQRSVELAAIGRRACEAEWDLLRLLDGEDG